MTEPATSRPRLIIPVLGGLYSALHESAETLLRVAAGALLATHGYGKILDPFGMTSMVEHLGFYPGVFWSPLLAATEFFGGILIAIGLFTRAAALANGVMLAITWWFHITHPYGDAFLTAAGIDALKAGGDLFTPVAATRLADGGAAFLKQVQEKAELASMLWTGGVFLFAAIGGGWLSVDRRLGKVF